MHRRSSVKLISGLMLLSGCGSGAGSPGVTPVPVIAVAPLCVTSQAADSSPGRSHHLAAVGCSLGSMDLSTYLPLQQKWTGRREAACNLFVITALCESAPCANGIDGVEASDFGSYLRDHGWKEVSPTELRSLFQSGADFDAIVQFEGAKKNAHGHVLIPVSYDAESDQLTLAQGELAGSPNQVMTDRFPEVMRYGGRAHIWVLE